MVMNIDGCILKVMTFTGMCLGKLGSRSRMYHFGSQDEGYLAEIMNIDDIYQHIRIMGKGSACQKSRDPLGKGSSLQPCPSCSGEANCLCSWECLIHDMQTVQVVIYLLGGIAHSTREANPGWYCPS